MIATKETIAGELRSVERLSEILDTVARAGGPDVYAVGGLVRDLLLGESSLDVDIVVEGDAIDFAKRHLAALVDAAGQRGEAVVHPDFGTVSLTWDDLSLDVVTARSETYDHPAALPTVTPGTIEDDLARRDFAANAIAASLAAGDFGRIVDPFGGRADLDARMIRVLHDRSFVDDPTRILRAIRYENRLGFRMDETTEHLAREAVAAGYIGRLSGQRLGEELLTLLAATEIGHTLERLDGLGLDRAIHPALSAGGETPGLVARLDALRRELAVEIPAWRPRLTALVRAVPSGELRELLDGLGVRRRSVQLIEATLRLAPELPGITDPAALADAVDGYGPDAPLFALAGTSAPLLEEWFARLRHVRLEITGADLAELGLPESPRVGEVLAELRCRKLRGELDGREPELAAARELIGER